MIEIDKEWFAANRAEILNHAVNTQTGRGFVVYDEKRDNTYGMISVRRTEIGRIDDLQVLENLRTNTIISLRQDLVNLGERKTADRIIHSSANEVIEDIENWLKENRVKKEV